jgi:hypothetical protein
VRRRNPQTAGTGILVASGTTAYMTELCPDAGQQSRPYTTSGNTFVLYGNDGPYGSVTENVFTKQ